MGYFSTKLPAISDTRLKYMNILSINFNHDGSAVVLRDGNVAGYVCTERFSRRKKHPGVRETDLLNLLNQADLSVGDVDLVQLLNLNLMDSPDVPALHGTNLKETWPHFWINQSFDKVRLLNHTFDCVLPTDHHLYHAALAYYFSPFESGISLACDPIGAEVHVFSGHRLLSQSVQCRMVSPDVYTLVSSELFGSGLTGAGKVMALAPYGSSDSAKIDYAGLARMSARQAFETLLAEASVSPVLWSGSGSPLNASLAFYAQAFLEFELSRLLRALCDKCSSLGIEPNLCLSGGTALNSVANHRCFSESAFRRLYLHPASGDDGTPFGAALLHWHDKLGNPKQSRSYKEAMYSCRTYDHEVRGTIQRYSQQVFATESKRYIHDTVDMIMSGKVIGWYQGASEIGPRALGNRSILADPRSATMKDYINRAIKKREAFRPFAPSILVEESDKWFGLSESPFMLQVASVASDLVPAVTHVDRTARVQTVTRFDNPRFYDLIKEFHRRTGIPMLLNTSFNGKGEPIVETPEDAINCMLQTGLDAVVFPDVVVRSI
jgi:carbamoyltransferase